MWYFPSGIFGLILLPGLMYAQSQGKLYLQGLPETGVYLSNQSDICNERAKIIIAEFKINYLMDVEFAGAGSKHPNSEKPSQRISINTPDDFVLQELTNKLFTFYLDELNQSGLQVLSYQKLLESDVFRAAEQFTSETDLHVISDIELETSKVILSASGKSFTAGNRKTLDFSNKDLLENTLSDIGIYSDISLNTVELTINCLSPSSLSAKPGKNKDDLICGIYPVYSKSIFYCPNQIPWVLFQNEWHTQIVPNLIEANNIKSFAGNEYSDFQVNINTPEYIQATETQLKAYLKSLVQSIQLGLKKS